MIEQNIPDKFKITPQHSNLYLVNGELKKWEGETTEVFSVIKTGFNSGISLAKSLTPKFNLALN